jgi:SAM-dependent methyltransferase
MTLSLRDPSGQICIVNERVLRVVNSQGLPDLQAFLASDVSAEFVESAGLVNTSFFEPGSLAEVLEHKDLRDLYEQSPGATIVEHERVPFTSYPYEWPAEMLYVAAELTLKLAEKILDDGIGLKDATPYNVLFKGSHPVFVDLLSFEQRSPGDPTWLPLAQFVRTFLLPLVVNKHFGISLAQLLTTHRDGIEPEEVLQLLGPLQKFRSPFLTLVSIPAWLAARDGAKDPKIYEPQTLRDPAKARFILQRLMRGMRRKLVQAAPRTKKTSVWSDYMEKNNYSQDYFPLKQAFVSDALRQHQPQNVLDVGCNTGHFSVIAARSGARVVAIDYDAVVVGEVWRQARTEDLDILPLVVNLARPTPGTGWLNQENSAFLDRARGAFDAVLMLGVVHHLLVSEGIPLPEIIRLAAELTTDLLVIEFVAPADPMFRRLTRGRDHLFQALTRESFEQACDERFVTLRCQRLDQTSRWLYLMKKKDVGFVC